MASPVHRYLFSPPTSPTTTSSRTRGSHSPLLEPHESLHAIGRLLSPALGGSSNIGGDDGGDKKYTPTQTQMQLAGPAGGFVSTRAYPTRCVSPLDLASSSSSSGHTLPPFPPTSSSTTASAYQPRRSASRSRQNSFVGGIGGGLANVNIPTMDYLLPPPAGMHQRSTTNTSMIRKPYTNISSIIRPKTAVRLIIAVLAILGINYLLQSSTSAALFPGLQLVTSEGARQQLLNAGLDMEKISVVAGKKVRVTGQFGAPTTLLYDDAAYHAVAPARTYRPIVSPPITETQELLALQSYLLSNPTHSLPDTTPTNRPLDPMTLVGFPPNDARGWKELAQEVEPVVIWSTGKTWTTPVQQILDLYGIEPQPVVLELEGRSDEQQLSAILARLVPGRSAALASSSRSPPPLITIAGHHEPINGYAPLLTLHKEGKLHALLERAGAVVDARAKREEGERVRRAMLQRRLAKQARVVVPARDVEGDDE